MDDDWGQIFFLRERRKRSRCRARVYIAKSESVGTTRLWRFLLEVESVLDEKIVFA